LLQTGGSLMQMSVGLQTKESPASVGSADLQEIAAGLQNILGGLQLAAGGMQQTASGERVAGSHLHQMDPSLQTTSSVLQTLESSWKRLEAARWTPKPGRSEAELPDRAGAAGRRRNVGYEPPPCRFTSIGFSSGSSRSVVASSS